MRKEYEVACSLCNLPAKLSKDWPFRIVLKICSRLLTCSEQMKKYYSKEFAVRSGKISVMPNWVNTEKLRIEKRKAGNTILFLHWLSERKGTRILPEIFSEISSKMKDVKFIVVGEGPDFQFLKDEFKKRELNVEMPGAVPNKDISSYFKRADIFINPSREEEFGRVIIEAMAAGTVPVAIDRYGPGDIIKDKLTGRLSDLDIKQFSAIILQLLTDKRQRELLSHAATYQASKFDTKDTAKFISYQTLFY